MSKQKINLKISGKSLVNREKASIESGIYDDLVTITHRAEIQVEQNRDSNSLISLPTLNDRDVVELIFEGGFTQWVRASELYEMLDGTQQRDSNDLVITPNSFRDLNNTKAERGLIGLALKFLKVLKLDLVQEIVDLGVISATEYFEKKRIAEPGVYQYTGKTLDDLTFCKKGLDIKINVQKPVLLFIHGIFTTGKGSFGDLWSISNEAYLAELLAPYGKQIFFLEHFTLSVSPVANALLVAKLFPTGTCFHIISHCQGGLIGELLCQGRLKRKTINSNGEFVETDTLFSEQELSAFKGSKKYESDYDDLKELQRLLQVSEFCVERFVRIAAPARGTLLVSEKLEDMINAVYNVVNLIPVPQLIGVAEFLKVVLLAIIEKRSSPEALPGIESMMPKSPLIALLNRHSVQLKNELTVISGEIDGTGFITRLKEWIGNKLFEEDHDFVVNTAAMYGGCHRLEGAGRYFLDKGHDTSHYKYFQHETIRQRIDEALTKPLGEMGVFLPLHADFPSYEAKNRSESSEKQVSLYFIPGIFGSNLNASGNNVWMDLAALQWGDFSKLEISKAGVQAESLISGAYEPLLSYLSETHNIVPFAYDWRRSYLVAGRNLGEALSLHLDKIKKSSEKHTIRILAHSTGGLVIKAMILEHPKVWKKLTETTDFQVVMLGAPLLGSHRIVQLLANKHRLTQLMTLLENPVDDMDNANQFSQYPGVLELLPSQSEQDFFDKKTWESILGKRSSDWLGYDELERAKSVVGQLNDVDIRQLPICYVAGQSGLTPIDYRLENKELVFVASKAGDGFSAWNGNDLPKDKLWFIPAEHGRLVNYLPAFKGISDLLQTANTQQLSQQLPNVDDDEKYLIADSATLYPDEKEVRAAALCFSTKASKQEQEISVNISVVHGNLEHVKHAIVVGHYEGDSIVSAEHVLDQRLNGRMSELHRLGMYPGGINTSKILINKDSKPAGAIITGLGEVGKLTAGDLLDTYTHALLDYALMLRDHRENHGHKEVIEQIPLSISTLLVGSGFGGLQPQDSIMCILRAIKRANKALKKNHQGRNSSIISVEFVELYEDRAVETIKFVQKIVKHFEYRKDFLVSPYLGSLPGGNRRVVFEQQAGWWQRIQIEGDEYGTLKYLTLTNKARVESELQPTQSKLVEKFVDVAIKDSNDDREIGQTLFELLVPNELKDHTHDIKNLVLVLNNRSAGLPWELMHNRLDVGADPISVSSGMLRQLQTTNYRKVVINPSNRTALVIGNPKTKNFSYLKAATSEAKSVSKQLIQQGFDTTSKIESNARSILTALHTSDYRVLHLAGHGVFDYDNNGEYEYPVTGMVLGDDIFLTPVEIHQMRKVPEFAFINCCHLGKIEEIGPEESWKNRHKLAASLAAELINMGVRAVVAAGWAINDSAAEMFSDTFYQCLLKGQTFGESVMEARRQTYANFKESNTWGAYQCYGDPDYVLTHHAASDANNTVSKNSSQTQYVSENEVLVALQNLSNSSDSSRISNFTVLQSTLSNIEQYIPIEWLSRASIRTALGRAHGKLDNFEQSIMHYEATQKIQFANYPVSLLEDMVSLKTAWALVLNKAEETIPKANSLIAEALKTLDLLDHLGKSIERWEERGKAWKRKAMISVGRTRSTALKNMEKAYEQAHTLALAECLKVSPYPLINWQTSKVIRHLRNQRNKLDKGELIYWLNQAKQYANNRHIEEPSFCSGVALAECTILSYIIENDELSKREIINRTVDYYSQAIIHGAAPRQIRFVSEHLEFLIEMLITRKNKNDEINVIVKVLEEILEMLRGSLQ